MKITSCKKAIILGFVCSIITILICIGYMYIINYFTYGEPFITVGMTKKVINGVSFIFATACAVLVAALIPLLTLRYTSRKHLIVYILVSVASYILVFFLIFYSVFMMINPVYDNFLYESPLNHFDAFWYALIVFPVGSMIGTILSIVSNELKLRKTTRI